MEEAFKPDRTPLSILFSLVRTWQVLERYLELELQKQGSSVTRFALMNSLYRYGGRLTPTELAAETFRSKNAITFVLGMLEKEGFVKRVPSDNDGRSVNVVITDKGWEKTNNMTPWAQDISRDILSCLDSGEINTLLIMFRTIRKSLLEKIDSLERNSSG